MTQQLLFDNANERYKRKLFISTGYDFIEVKARIIEPYAPPTPQLKNQEIKVINAPSHFQHLGISSYKCSLTLLFYDKESYADYVQYVGWTHKFYDEKGNIYLGSVDSVKVVTKEANTKYAIEITMSLVKKDRIDTKLDVPFQDIQNTWFEKDVIEMAQFGLVQLVNIDGTPVLYFKPNNIVTRAEFITFLNRTRRLLDKIIRE